MKKPRAAGSSRIEGVELKPLRVNVDERGRLMEMLRVDDSHFIKFGQAYLTTAYPGVVKAWHCHEKQTDHFVVVSGMAKVVCYDGRRDSPTRGRVGEFFLGEHNQQLLQIPPRVWHGFKCISDREIIVINLPTESYNRAHPDEIRLPAHTKKIPYDWARSDG